MSSEYLSHYPADAIPHGAARGALVQRPAPLLTLAKLVLIVGGLAYFMPIWLNLLSQLGATESWYALRLLAFGGSAGIVMLSVLSFKLAGVLLARRKVAAVR